MKKMLDKPCRSLNYKNLCKEVAIQTSVAITILVSMSLIGQWIPSTHKNVETIVVKESATSIIEPASQAEVIDTPNQEVQTATLKTERVILSRGGSPFKQKTEREMINDYTRDISAKYNMDPTLIMSIIQQESEYNPKAKNGNCLGLMQVSSYWHKNRAEKLGITDFYDPYSNILLGIDYLSELYSQYKDMRLVLMLYNMDHNTAISMFKNGQISSYAKTIIARAEQYKKGE